MGLWSYRICILRRRDTRELTLSVCTCEGHGEMVTISKLGYGLSSEIKLTVSWTSNLQSEKINFCYLSHPVCAILLWQPNQTNTPLYTCSPQRGSRPGPAWRDSDLGEKGLKHGPFIEIWQWTLGQITSNQQCAATGSCTPEKWL